MAEGEGLSKVPENLKKLLLTVGIFVPHNLDEQEQEVYQRGLEGRCMTCDGELGENTMVVVNQLGIVQVVCCGACLQDMQVTGWIQETYQEMIDKIKFRGGRGDEI